MVDPAGDVALSPVEFSLYNNVQALLKDLKSQSASQKGVLRWSLQKRMEAEPSNSVSLIRVLVKELDSKQRKIDKTQYMHIIPVLHTLYYAVIQSGVMIPASLYQAVYECLMKLLILPSPHSDVALNTLKSIKMEMTTPGSLYQRRVTAEQNLKNEYFSLQEKVFVLADPAVFSDRLEAAVRAHLGASNVRRDTPTVERNVVLRVMQMGLGTSCHSSRLAQALEALEEHTVDKYFQEVVLAVEESLRHGAADRSNYVNKLHQIYRDILTAAEERAKQDRDHDHECSTNMPFPEITFLLWRNEEVLWDLLLDLSRSSYSNSNSVDEDKKDPAQNRDSGIERDLKETDLNDAMRSPVTNHAPAFARRNAFKTMKPGDKLSLMRDKMDTFPGSSHVLKEDKRRHTARVLVMGDDRVLGRLTRAFHTIRKRESKRLVLTKKLDLRFYYVPVSDVVLSSPDDPGQDGGRLSLASLLGTVDPWYNSNINSLGAAISKLAGKQSNNNEPPEQSLFLLDSLSYYLRCGTQPVNLPLYSVKMTSSSSEVVEEVFVSHLVADIPEFRHLKEKISKPSARRRKSTVEVIGAVMSVSYTKISLSRREVVKGEAPMTYAVVITSEPAALTSGGDRLNVRFDSLNPAYNMTIRTQKLSIRMMEHRSLSVCLDKDVRRTFTDVQRIEILPCLDPGCSSRSRFSLTHEQEPLFSKYLNTVLSLPIHTFTGVSP